MSKTVSIPRPAPQMVPLLAGLAVLARGLPCWTSQPWHPQPVFKLVLVLIAAICCLPVTAFGQAIEIHDLDANPAPHLGKSVIVRGRLQSAGAGHLHLVGSPIDFRYTEARVPIRPGTTHVELEGRLAREQNRLVLHLDSLLAIPSEEQEFIERRQKLKDENFQALYELSRWARARAKWYDDLKLRELASQSYRQAFGWEEEALARHNNFAGLLQLADRGQQLGLEAADVQRIRYRALVLGRSRLPKGDPAAWQSLADEVRKLLPATDRPAPASALRQGPDSADELIRAYATADASRRSEMHRALWTALVAQLFELRSEQHANLLELAHEARRILPEREDLAQRLELSGWRREAAHPQTLSREALVATRDGLARLEQPVEARSLVVHWLRLRREMLPADEAEDRIQLAEDYLELADDRAAAAELYREAWANVPDFAAAASGLRRLGYEQIGGVWREASSLKVPAGDEGDFLRPGTSEAEVVRRLRRPDRVTRTATRRWIVEQWNYAGPPSLVVYLRRDTAGGGGTVTRMAQSD